MQQAIIRGVQLKLVSLNQRDVLHRVNSDDFFRVMQPIDRPAQQACSITAARGAVGRYRYLLWAVEPTQSINPLYLNNTFYAEFDVYAEP